MQGIIINYRRGRHTMNPYQMIIEPIGVKGIEDAKKLVGKKVIYKTSSGKFMIGKITALHGRKGAVRARFKKGLPGQAIGQKVEIVKL